MNREKTFNQRQREAFFTPQVLADFMTKRVIDTFLEEGGDLETATFLEPSAGKGSLVDSFLELVSEKTGQTREEIEKRCTLFELDAEDARYLKEKYPRATVYNGDFLLWQGDYQFDICLANPPWGRFRVETSEFYERYHQRLRGICAKEKEKVYKDFFEENGLCGEFKKWEREKRDTYAEYKKLYSQDTLEKCFFLRVHKALSAKGMAGMLSGDSIATDSKSTRIREKLYKTLRFLFRFHNEKKLFEDVHHCTKYIMSIFGGSEKKSFTLMDNLFHPESIEKSETETEQSPYPSTKNSKGEWELRGHPHRLVTVDENLLKEISLFTGAKDHWHSVLPTIHGKPEQELFIKLASFDKVGANSFSYYRSIEETASAKKGLITRSPRKHALGETVLTGSNIFVSHPSNKEPNEGCSHNQDFTPTNLQTIPEDFHPKSVFKLTEKGKMSPEYLRETPWGSMHNEDFRVAVREFVGSTTGERTLQAAVIPPVMTHINSVVTVVFPTQKEVVLTGGFFESLIYDFLVRTLSNGHVNKSVIQILPTISLKHQNNILVQALAARTLRLNCISNHYAPLYKEIMGAWSKGIRAIDAGNLYQNHMKACFVSETLEGTPLPCSYGKLPDEWSMEVPLRKFEDREQALCETDALVAILFGIPKDTLLNLYRAQFAVLQKNNQDFPNQEPKEGKQHYPRYRVMGDAYDLFDNYREENDILTIADEMEIENLF